MSKNIVSVLKTIQESSAFQSTKRYLFIAWIVILFTVTPPMVVLLVMHVNLSKLVQMISAAATPDHPSPSSPNQSFPNIVHMVMSESCNVSIVNVICIRSVALHQKPQRLYIHCPCDRLYGPYDSLLQDIPQLSVSKCNFSKHGVDRNLTSEIVGVLSLTGTGGIYLTANTYLVKNVGLPAMDNRTLVAWPVNDHNDITLMAGNPNAAFLWRYLYVSSKFVPSVWMSLSNENRVKLASENDTSVVDVVIASVGLISPEGGSVTDNDWHSKYTAVTLTISNGEAMKLTLNQTIHDHGILGNMLRVVLPRATQLPDGKPGAFPGFS